jgi:molybdate transport system substrate-binding protein
MNRNPRRRCIGQRILSILIFATSFIATESASAASPTTVNILAASSLQVQYTALAKKFEAAHSGIKINISFGSSATLANQIASGAPVDIFVSADQASMATAKSEIINPVNYVINQVVVAIPTNSNITKIRDLNGKVKWIQCARTAPCGIAADSALKAEGSVTSSPVSLEASASSTLAKLLAGAVDAAIVYKTDVLANSAKLRPIYFSDAQSASTQYQIGLSKSAIEKKNRWANTFLLYLRSSEIRKSLAKAGFQVDSLK